jgi:hypothetical protein
MSYHLCPNIIDTILKEIPINKCYNPPQPTETFQYLPLLTGFFYILFIILLINTNILTNIIVLILRLLKFVCATIIFLPSLPSYLFNIFHSFKHLLLSILLPFLLYLLSTLSSILFHFLYLLNWMIYILLFSYSLLYKIIHLVNTILLSIPSSLVVFFFLVFSQFIYFSKLSYIM